MVWPESSRDETRPLAGVRILVVEDDPFILMDIEAVLGDAGAVIAGTASSVNGALDLIERSALDVVLLDFGLGRETAAPIARALTRRGTPFLFYTGQVETDPRLAEWSGRPIIAKPAAPRVMVGAIARVVGAAAS